MDTKEYKDKIVSAMIDDDELSQAIMNKNDDFLKTIPPFPLRNEIMKNKNIFKYFNLGEIQEEAESYIFMQFRFKYNDTGTIAGVDICFYIFVHEDLQKTDEGILRLDFITSRLKSIFNNNTNIGARIIIDIEKDQPSYKKYIASLVSFNTISMG